MRTPKILFRVALAAVLLPTAAYADDQDTIEYRRHIMRTIDEQSAALGMILATSIPSDNATAHLETIALVAKTAIPAFEPKVLGGEASPKVWSDWNDFSRRMNEFAKKTSEVATLAKEKGYDAELAPMILDALSCKSCHEIYRIEKGAKK